MKFGVYPYRQGSVSAAAIAEGLGGVVMRRQGSKFSPNGTVINWGGHTDLRKYPRVVNRETEQATNKLNFFKMVKDHARVPVFFTSRGEAREKLKYGNATIVVRKTLTGQAGAGIEIIEPGSGLDIPEAPLYTVYVPKDQEWRLHFVKDRLVHSQRKIKDPDIDQPKTWKVRTHGNGFIYQQNNPGGPPEDVIKQATAAFKASGLDFGALDVIYNKRENKAYVLEANTAPGCDRGSATARAYCEAFNREFR